MQTSIYVSFDPGERNRTAKEATKLVSQFDLFTVNSEEEGGIDTVRELISFTTKKPIQSDFNLVLIKEAHYLTLEAQNALLKILEEPPVMTKIVLIAPSLSHLLPTVISRCQVIEINPGQKETHERIIDWALLETAVTGSNSEQLKIAEDLDWSLWIELWHGLLVNKITGIDEDHLAQKLTVRQIQIYLKKLLSLTKLKEDHANSKLLNQFALLSSPKIRS